MITKNYEGTEIREYEINDGENFAKIGIVGDSKDDEAKIAKAIKDLKNNENEIRG